MMNKPFDDLIVIELAGVLAGPSVGLFFAELGARVIKIENPKTNGDVTRSWKLKSEDVHDPESAYYWSVNARKEILFIDLSNNEGLQQFYSLVKKADILITNYKSGDDHKLKVDYLTVQKFNSHLIYASINGFGKSKARTAYDLILQAESGFMFMNGEKNSSPLKMPVALIDILAGHQLKEAILVALLNRHKTSKGCHVSVSLFDAAVASLANQATNWLIAHQLPVQQGSLHPNIAPYGEIFLTRDKQLVTFAIGTNTQFKMLCEILKLQLHTDPRFTDNQQRVANREQLFEELDNVITNLNFASLFDYCLTKDIPIGKIRNLEEVFQLPEAKKMVYSFNHLGKEIRTVKSIAFVVEE